jgi:hypothetical protein
MPVLGSGVEPSAFGKSCRHVFRAARALPRTEPACFTGRNDLETSAKGILMANYVIIGGDGKEYGPVTDTDVRQWIAEGRLSAQSRAKAESDAEFRPLAAFPEFADAFGLNPDVPPAIRPLKLHSSEQPANPAPGGREEALRAIKAPAIALKITAIIGLVVVTLGFIVNILTLAGVEIFPKQPMPNPQMEKLLNSIGGGVGIVQDIIGAVIGILVYIGAGKMQRLEGYQFAMVAAIAAMVPCLSPCCLLGLPFGIWALIVLNKPEVKSYFTN